MSSKKINDRDYLHICAVIRARETALLTPERMERMLDAPGFDDAAKLLCDCGFEDLSGCGFDEIERSLSKRREVIFEEIRRLAPEPRLVDVFRLRYDYHNAKVLIKAEAANVDGVRMISGAGSIGPQVLTDGFHNGEYRDVPLPLAEAMRRAKDVLARTGNAQLADFILDRSYFECFGEMAKELGSEFLNGYFRLSVDSNNLKACVRTVRMGKDIDFLRTALVPGGNVEEERLAAAAMSGEGLAPLFVASPLYAAATASVSVIGGGSLTEFERLCERALAVYLSAAKLVSFGEPPVTAYLNAVESDITAVRVILTGRLSGISPATIRERLSDRYA